MSAHISRCPHCGTDLDTGVDCWKCHGDPHRAPTHFAGILFLSGKWIIAIAVNLVVIAVVAAIAITACSPTIYTVDTLKAKVQHFSESEIVTSLGDPWMSYTQPNGEKVLMYKHLIVDDGKLKHAIIVPKTKAWTDAKVVPYSSEDAKRDLKLRGIDP